MGRLSKEIQQINNITGENITSDDPCEHIRFSNAQAAVDPNYRRIGGSEEVWNMIQRECPTETLSAPFSLEDLTTAPDEGEQVQDSAQSQGIDLPEGDNEGRIEILQEDQPESPSPDEEPTRPSEGEPHPELGGDQPHNQTDVVDPINIFNGSFYIQETDLDIPNTILPLSFIRTYRSGISSFGPLGWNWDHNYNLFLRELNTGDIALWRNLNEDVFKFDGINYESPRGVFWKLQKISELPKAYEITSSGGTTMHFKSISGLTENERIPILWIRDRHGNQLSFSYDNENKLIEVKDDDDRFLKFKYDSCKLIVEVSDHTNRIYSYSHNEETLHLNCVKSPPIKDHPEGITKIYHYENPNKSFNLRHNIVRVEDSRGNVYLENIYEQDPSSFSFARVKEQLYGDFLYQFKYTQLQWVPRNSIFINIPALRAEVMNPDYGLETLTFNYRGDLLDRRFRLKIDKSFRVVVWKYDYDNQGNLSKVTKPNGSEELSIFDFSNPDPKMRNNLLQREITSASGFPSPSRIIWRGKYESIYQLLIEEKNELNSITKYKYDFNINPTSTNNTGKLLEIHEQEALLPDESVQTCINKMEYNNKGQVIAGIQGDGVRYELIYGTSGEEKNRLVKQILDVGGLNVQNTVNYNEFGFQNKFSDGNGNVNSQIINALGLAEQISLPSTDGSIAIINQFYSSDKKVIGTERPKGNYSDALLNDEYILDKMDRDVLGHPVKYYLSFNTEEKKEIRICRGFRGYPIEIINPDGSKILRDYDERGLLLSHKIVGADKSSLISKKTYDRSAKLIRKVSSTGGVTKYEYDGFSRLIKLIYPNNTIIKLKWGKNDLLESEEVIGDNGNGIIGQLSFKKYTYDRKGRRISVSIKYFENDPTIFSDITSVYIYDCLDRVIGIIDHRGSKINYEYDNLGRISKEIDSLGNEKKSTYDNNGNIIQIDNLHKEPDGTTSVITKKFKYDGRNRRIEIIEPDGAKIAFQYDDRNLIVKETNHLGIIKEIDYNSFNKKIKEVHDVGGLNIIHRWGLDSMSRINAYVDPTNQKSLYHRDHLGRNYKTEYPNGFISTKKFNEKGLIIEEILGSGVKFKYFYDPAGRLIKIENSVVPRNIIQVEPEIFRYDGLNRIVSAKVGTNEVSRNYDSLNRLLSETAIGETISQKYNDSLGEVEKIWSDGRIEKYSHNSVGSLTQITKITNGNLGASFNEISSFKLSGDKFLAEMSGHGGLSITNNYDERKRLTETRFSSPTTMHERIIYRYDKANRKQVEAIIGHNPKLSYFESDNKNKLLLVSEGFNSSFSNITTQAEHDASINSVKLASTGGTYLEKFIYNNAGARLKYEETGRVNRDYLYNSGHRIQTDGINSFSHHTDGTLKSDTKFIYEVDALGRVIKISSGIDLVSEIEYDAFGRPSIIKEIGMPVLELNYFGKFVQQEKEDGVVSKQITLFPSTGIPIAIHNKTSSYYTLFDNRFNLIGLANDSGDIVESYRYKSFGFPSIYDESNLVIPSSKFGIDPIFGGQRYLKFTGLYMSKHRLMDPNNGLYLSTDSFGYSDSSSLYVYAAQNPVDLIDPDGDLAFLAILGIMAVGALVAGAFNTARQGIAISEGAQREWEWGQFGASMGMGAVIAPVAVFAPEVLIPLGVMGIEDGISEIKEGHYFTGAFDIGASALMIRGARNSPSFGARLNVRVDMTRIALANSELNMRELGLWARFATVRNSDTLGNLRNDMTVLRTFREIINNPELRVRLYDRSNRTVDENGLPFSAEDSLGRFGEIGIDVDFYRSDGSLAGDLDISLRNFDVEVRAGQVEGIAPKVSSRNTNLPERANLPYFLASRIPPEILAKWNQHPGAFPGDIQSAARNGFDGHIQITDQMFGGRPMILNEIFNSNSARHFNLGSEKK